MRNKSILLMTALVIFTTGISDGQVGNILRNKLNKAIGKEVQNKADSAGNKDQNEQQAEGRRGLGGLLGGKTDIKHNDVYEFTGRIYMTMETYEKKDVKKSDYFTYFNSSIPNAGIEVRIADPDNKDQSVPTTFLFDGENRCFMILMEGTDSKTGIISTIPDDSTLNAQAKGMKNQEQKPAVITKTGNSKIIAGYRCDEYKVVEPGEEGYSNVWMTKDVKIKADKRYWSKAGMPAYYGHPEFEGSMMLAFDTFDKSGKPEMKMETREINENFRHSISTTGFSFIKMNFGQAGKK
ncbi:MAG TPA: DUF4412 domain-containing protein [Bacteroidales bacterium]|jgi:hypothetical protein|nr:DUF4412 domain-containing protein [Bacteroidales bacterium]